MRALTSRQRKLLDKIYIKYQPDSSYELTDTDYLALEKINDYETLLQDIDRYLWDLRFK